MKKLIFAVLIAMLGLLAMVAVACDSAVFPGRLTSEPPAPPPPEGMVRLSIGIEGENASRARALVVDHADITNWEVAFYDGTNYYRKAWDNTTQTTAANILVPPGNYNTTGSAILFGGDSNHTLLAVGRLIEVGTTSSTTTGTNIEITTKYVTFSMASFTTQITADNSTSSFTITSPTDFATKYPIIPITTIGDVEYQLYPVLGGTVNTATYKINHKYGDGVAITGASSATFSTRSTSLGDMVASPTGSDGATSITISPTESDTLPTTGGFSITFTPVGDEEVKYTMLYIEVPVKALHGNGGVAVGNNLQTAGEWKIRGGKDNTTPAKTTNKGGAILFQINPSYAQVDVIGRTTDDES